MAPGTEPATPETWFAPAPRASEWELNQAIDLASTHPVMDAVLRATGGLLAILDRHRQVVALNRGLLDYLGVDDPQQVLGLRPGEVLDCAHAQDHPGGCGTSRFCATCGAAIAIVSCMAEREPMERECVLTVAGEGHPTHLDLAVRAVPIEVEGRGFVLLLLQDVSALKRRAALESTFFHDIRNLVQGIVGVGSLFDVVAPEEYPALGERLARLSWLLAREVDIQATLLRGRIDLRLELGRVQVAELLDEVERVFRAHPVARGRSLVVASCPAGLAVETDLPIAVRVVANMVANALEASEEGGEVRVEAVHLGEHVQICVWNAGFIPDSVAMRLFQRYFSTKAGEGRGTGTYAMKLFGEQVLGGEVGFTTSEEHGTVFRFAIPMAVV